MPRMQTVFRSAVVFCLLCLLSACANLSAQTKPARTEVGGDGGRSLLWVGNSFFYYNNSMHGHYGNLARAGNPGGKYRGTSVTISGSGIDWHDAASAPSTRS